MMAEDRKLQRCATLLDTVRAEGRTALTAPEGKVIADAYGIAVPRRGAGQRRRRGGGVRRRARRAGRDEDRLAGHPAQDRRGRRDRRRRGRRRRTGRVPQDHRQRAGVQRRRPHRRACRCRSCCRGGRRSSSARSPTRRSGRSSRSGSAGCWSRSSRTSRSGSRPVDADEALSMLDSIRAAEILRGRARRAPAVDRWALAEQIRRVSRTGRGLPGDRARSTSTR